MTNQERAAGVIRKWLLAEPTEGHNYSYQGFTMDTISFTKGDMEQLERMIVQEFCGEGKE